MNDILKPLLIRDDQHKFRDIGDVIAIARAEGKKLLHSDENVKVVDIIIRPYGYIVVVKQ